MVGVKTAMDYYKADLTLQGPLSKDQLIDRTNGVDFKMATQYKDTRWSIGFFENHSREEWVKLLGIEYVALRVIAPANKENRITVLFTIQELRDNWYVHYHGFEWNDDLEQKYNQSNTKYLAKGQGLNHNKNIVINESI